MASFSVISKVSNIYFLVKSVDIVAVVEDLCQHLLGRSPRLRCCPGCHDVQKLNKLDTTVPGICVNFVES
jgi:hypothetical protein